MTEKRLVQEGRCRLNGPVEWLIIDGRLIPAQNAKLETQISRPPIAGLVSCIILNAVPVVLCYYSALPGIAERAKIAGWRLMVRIRPETGTEVELSVSGSVAYAKPSRLREAVEVLRRAPPSRAPPSKVVGL